MRGIVLGCGLWALDLRSGGFAMVVQPFRPTRCPGFLIGGVPERDRLSSQPSGVAKHAGVGGDRRNCDDRPLTEMGVGWLWPAAAAVGARRIVAALGWHHLSPYAEQPDRAVVVQAVQQVECGLGDD